VVDLEGSRPLEYRQWSREKLTRACDDVRQGKLSIRRAELAYNIPKSTIQDHVSGHVADGVNPGHRKYLTESEEVYLVSFLIKCSDIGYARSRKQILCLVESYLQDVKGLTTKLSNGWWEKFKARHSELSIRTAERLAYNRAISSNQNIINNYFEMLKHTLEDNKILDVPNQIYNMDESGFPLQHKPPKIVARKGTKHAVAITANDKAQITVLACVSASGSTLPPMVIFDRKLLKPELTWGEVPGTLYGLTANGWSNSEMFELWFHNHFLRYIPAVRPVLLLMDGHSSHYNPTTIKMAAKEKVVMFCLPPHTTHFTQPLDKSCFSALKAAWNAECHQYTIENHGKTVTRFTFSQLFSKSWYRAMTARNIISGFRTCGVCPLNPSVFQPAPSNEADSEEESIRKESGLAYIPLLTPTRRSSCTEKGDEEIEDSSDCEDSDIARPSPYFHQGEQH